MPPPDVPLLHDHGVCGTPRRRGCDRQRNRCSRHDGAMAAETVCTTSHLAFDGRALPFLEDLSLVQRIGASHKTFTLYVVLS